MADSTKESELLFRVASRPSDLEGMLRQINDSALSSSDRLELEKKILTEIQQRLISLRDGKIPLERQDVEETALSEGIKRFLSEKSLDQKEKEMEERTRKEKKEKVLGALINTLKDSHGQFISALGSYPVCGLLLSLTKKIGDAQISNAIQYQTDWLKNRIPTEIQERLISLRDGKIPLEHRDLEKTALSEGIKRFLSKKSLDQVIEALTNLLKDSQGQLLSGLGFHQARELAEDLAKKIGDPKISEAIQLQIALREGTTFKNTPGYRI